MTDHAQTRRVLLIHGLWMPRLSMDWLAPRGYSDQGHHLRNFIAAVRTRKPAVEGAVVGLGRAGRAPRGSADP